MGDAKYDITMSTCMIPPWWLDKEGRLPDGRRVAPGLVMPYITSQPAIEIERRPLPCGLKELPECSSPTTSPSPTPLMSKVGKWLSRLF
jgi:hypothetical protein